MKEEKIRKEAEEENRIERESSERIILREL